MPFLFAGLLKISGLAIAWMWNNVFTQFFQIPYISTLEAVGVFAFVYLVYSGFRFGFANMNDNLAKINQTNVHECDIYAEPDSIRYAKSLPEEEPYHS